MSNLWLTAKCPICGNPYQFTKDQIYKPHTCGSYDCVHKFSQRPDYMELTRFIDKQRQKIFAHKP